jgi:hypothetical protein
VSSLAPAGVTESASGRAVMITKPGAAGCTRFWALERVGLGAANGPPAYPKEGRLTCRLASGPVSVAGATSGRMSNCRAPGITGRVPAGRGVGAQPAAARRHAISGRATFKPGTPVSSRVTASDGKNRLRGSAWHR